MKKMYAAGAIAITVMAVAGMVSPDPVHALEVKSGNDDVSVTLYGQIDRGILYVDDGLESKAFHVDNDNSSSRIGIKAKAKASDNLTLGAKFEVELQSNASNKVDMGTEHGSSYTEGSVFKERHIDFYADTNFGKISIGQGDTASNGSAEVDLSGTGLVGYSSVVDTAGNFEFYDKVTMSYSGLKVDDVFNNMDGLSRKDRIRYDTPDFAGFTLSTSAGEKDIFDLAARYNQKFGDTKVSVAVAYADPGAGKNYKQYSASGSVLFGFGLNFGLAYGKQDVDSMPAGSDDPTYLYGKVGYSASLFPIGKSSFSVDYGKWQNIDSYDIDQEATSYGIQFVQKISDWSTEVYLGYRIYQLDDNMTTSYDDISALLGGVRIKF